MLAHLCKGKLTMDARRQCYTSFQLSDQHNHIDEMYLNTYSATKTVVRYSSHAYSFDDSEGAEIYRIAFHILDKGTV